MPAEHQADLLEELLRIEAEYRRRAGLPVSANEYARRMPEHIETINRALKDPLIDPGPRISETAIEDSAPPKQIGPYRLHEVIGQGGMGIVYRGEHEQTGRQVALKVLRPATVLEERPPSESLSRFLGEATIASRLEHPNIAPVYEVGEFEGQPYFAIRLFPDGDLAKASLTRAWDDKAIAEIIADVADAVQYAHDQQVIHRDIKSSNILLDEDQKPHLTDFGVAKLVGNTMGLTTEHSMLGSLPYMSPEQTCDLVAVDQRADVYGLGATLYFLLTGAPPFPVAWRPIERHPSD